MYFGVCIERKPVTDEWQPVRKVERAKTRPWIVARVLDVRLWCGQAKKTLQKGVECDGRVPFPPKSAVRSKPNSKFSVGLKLIFSTCTHGSPGLITFGTFGDGLAT